MKKYIAVVLVLLNLFVLSGCSQSSSSGESSPNTEDFMSDDDIVKAVEPYLEDMVFQDPSAYPSFDDFLKANLNIDSSEAESAVLYMGAPNQNTGCFLMVKPKENADIENIIQKLENKGESMTVTAQQGYTQGYSEYCVVQNQGRIFLLMHPEEEKYNELVNLVSDL